MLPSNRDLAGIVLVLALVGGAMLTKAGRDAAVTMAKTLWGRLLLLFLAYAAYIAGIIALAHWVGLWNSGMLGETVAWLLLSGLALFGRFSKVAQDRWFFRHSLRQLIEFGALITALVNVVNFNFVVELVLGLVVSLVVLLQAVAETDSNLQPARKVLSFIASLLGLGIGAATVASLIAHWEHIDKGQTLLSLAMAIWLPALVLPGVVVMAAVSEYELAFLRMSFMSGVPDVWPARLALLRGLKARPHLIAGFSHAWRWELRQAGTWSGALTVVNRYRAAQSQTLPSLLRKQANELARVASTGAGYYQPQPNADERVSALLWLLRTRAPGWEYMLFGLAMGHFVETIRGWTALRDRSPRAGKGAAGSRRGALRFLARSPQQAARIAEGIEGLFGEDVQLAAFGRPGEPGDAVAVVRLAEAVVRVEAELLELRHSTDTMVMDDDLRAWAEALQALLNEPVAQIEAFVEDVERRTARLPERLQRGEEIDLTFRVELAISDHAMARWREATRTVLLANASG